MVAKVFHWAGKIEEAGPAALEALVVSPQDRESLFIAGAYLKSIGRDQEGQEHFRRALEIEVAENPQDVEARVFLAKTLIELGETAEARLHLREALNLRPDSPEAAQLLKQAQQN
jgi:tetratricopeptide (TPR) repeat protein